MPTAILAGSTLSPRDKSRDYNMVHPQADLLVTIFNAVGIYHFVTPDFNPGHGSVKKEKIPSGMVNLEGDFFLLVITDSN